MKNFVLHVMFLLFPLSAFAQNISLNIEYTSNLDTKSYYGYNGFTAIGLFPVCKNIEIGPSFKAFRTDFNYKVFGIKNSNPTTGKLPIEIGLKLVYSALTLNAEEMDFIFFGRLGIAYQLSNFGGLQDFMQMYPEPYTSYTNAGNNFTEEIAAGLKISSENRDLKIYFLVSYNFLNSKVKYLEELYYGAMIYSDEYTKTVNLNSTLIGFGMQIKL